MKALHSFCIGRVALALATCLLHGLASLPAQAVVQVQAVDGRVLRGEIDSKSDTRLLWVRHAEERIVVTTSVAWSAIQSVQLDGAPIEITQLQQQLQQLASEGPKYFLAEHVVKKLQVADYPSKISTRIASIQVDAILVNLDRDVEPDGLQVAVVALNDQGEPLPVRGNLSARLWGQRSKSTRSLLPLKFEELQRWTQSVQREDFVDNVASYALRFRTVRPEFDFELWAGALLNVRLGIHGQGTYEASVPVIVRRFDPFRDSLQQYEGTRFLPGELTENVRRGSSRGIGLGLGIRSR
jgi:hypothetical protein